MAQDLTRMKCRLYPENTPPLDAGQIAQYMPAISPEWETVDNIKLRPSLCPGTASRKQPSSSMP